MPTETVYGLAADAGNARAVGAIFLAKGRPRFNPLIIHVASVRARPRDRDIHARCRASRRGLLAGAADAGRCRNGQHALVADLATAGLADGRHPRAGASGGAGLLNAFGGPLAAPSANRSGHVSATTAAACRRRPRRSRVAVILDAGPTPIGLESTIVGFDRRRAGAACAPAALPRSEIEAVLGRAADAAPTVDPKRAAALPACSPRTTPRGAHCASTRHRVAPGEALLAFGADVARGRRQAVAIVNLSEAGDLAEAATNFFAALRDLDGKAKVIAVAPIPERGLGEAINDRLRRAAAPRG